MSTFRSRVGRPQVRVSWAAALTDRLEVRR
jgi:hypothetical protein